MGKGEIVEPLGQNPVAPSLSSLGCPNYAGVTRGALGVSQDGIALSLIHTYPTPHPADASPAALGSSAREGGGCPLCQLGQHSFPLAREEQRGALQAILASNPILQKVRQGLVHTPYHPFTPMPY